MNIAFTEEDIDQAIAETADKIAELVADARLDMLDLLADQGATHLEIEAEMARFDRTNAERIADELRKMRRQLIERCLTERKLH